MADLLGLSNSPLFQKPILQCFNTTSGVARILLQGARAQYRDFESDAVPIFLSQNISDNNVSVVPIFP